jgi:hypothetical protein
MGRWSMRTHYTFITHTAEIRSGIAQSVAPECRYTRNIWDDFGEGGGDVMYDDEGAKGIV